MRRWRRAVPWTLLAALVAVGAGAGAASTILVFERFNQTFVDTVDEIAPIRKGPVTVFTSSPSHRLTVKSHSIELAPRDDLHFVAVTMRFLGEADLVMRVEAAGVPTTIEDQVRVPEQERRLESVIRLERDELDQGFDITPMELPENLEVTIESRLAGQIVSLCRAVTIFSLADAGCDELEHALAHPKVRLPPPGTLYNLPDSELAPDERRQLLDYLEAARGHRPPAAAPLPR